MTKITREEAVQRGAMFSALTGTTGASVTGNSNDVRGMLTAVYGTTRRGKDAIDTREAAKRLGVSQRTVQRWITGQNKPSTDHLKKLQTRSRQSATTKRGRARALKRATASKRIQTDAVRVRVGGTQGPQGYQRDRNSAQKLSPEEYQGLLDAYATGGDNGALNFLQSVYGEKYVDNWKFDQISDFRIDGLSDIDRVDPRAL